VLKARVTGTAALFAKRSPAAIVRTTAVGAVWASEVSIHINNKITQTIEVNAFREWLIILVLLLTPAFRNFFCY
jgi:hypothetical protein